MTTKSKNLINSLDDAVSETLSGLSHAYPRLEYHASHGVVLSPDVRKYAFTSVITFH